MKAQVSMNQRPRNTTGELVERMLAENGQWVVTVHNRQVTKIAKVDQPTKAEDIAQSPARPARSKAQEKPQESEE